MVKDVCKIAKLASQWMTDSCVEIYITEIKETSHLPLKSTISAWEHDYPSAGYRVFIGSATLV